MPFPNRLGIAALGACLLSGCTANDESVDEAGVGESALGDPAEPAAAECKADVFVWSRWFQRLEAQMAYVYVDEIHSSFLGYEPVAITVAVGKAYPPLSAPRGSLDPAAFERLMAGAYGVTLTRMRVSKDSTLRFSTVNGQEWELRVVALGRGPGGHALTLRLCAVGETADAI